MAASQHQQADLLAKRIRDDAKSIAVDQRGVTQWMNVKPETLPSSRNLSTGTYDSQTIFPNALTASKYHDVILSNTNQVDLTIPATPDARKAHVKVLFKAFKIVPQDEDEDDQGQDMDEQRKKRDVKQAFKNQIHDNRMVESLCWRILDACVYRSGKEQNLIEAYIGETGKSHGKRQNWSFEDRFDKIVQTMANSKSVCKHLLDTAYLHRIVDDPVTGYKRVVSNKRLNGRKGELMKRGKEVLEEEKQSRKRQKLEHDSDELDEDISQVSTPASSTQTTRRILPAIAPSTTRATRSGHLQMPHSGSHPLGAPAASMHSPILANYQNHAQPNPANMFNHTASNIMRPAYSSQMGVSGLLPPYQPPRATQHHGLSMYNQMPYAPTSYLRGYGPASEVTMPPQFPQSYPRSALPSGDTMSMASSEHPHDEEWRLHMEAENYGSHSYQSHAMGGMHHQTSMGYQTAGINAQEEWDTTGTTAHENIDPVLNQYSLLPSPLPHPNNNHNDSSDLFARPDTKAGAEPIESVEGDGEEEEDHSSH
ncbi:hypothetical protein LTS03_006524 [Exophiala xenobiotica]|nr:hypothetical protein LTS06_010074 [Exophiala xenobiotica]KAK5349181.1 hypothetical protein LTR61_007219 [Exophiala xenobiotica]KAK5365670.1 hypothetical protein LTR11_008552 [Exophiala xenobiotica]KAK5372836.1 hypothetical protein LTS03_006524 [Exophiala xenobiotica]